MKQLCTFGLAGLLLLCGTGVAVGQTTAPSRFGTAVRVSTLGVGLDVAVPLGKKANIRGGFNTFSLSHDFDLDGIDLAVDMRLRSFVAQLDYYPFGGGFHLSPGVMLYNGNGVRGLATVSSGTTFDLGDEINLMSNPANPVVGSLDVSFPRVAPSLVLGWGNLIPRGNRRWSIPFEIGVIYSRSPTAALNLAGSACSRPNTNCRNLATDAGLQNNVLKSQNEINDSIAPLKIIPVVSLGFSFKF